MSRSKLVDILTSHSVKAYQANGFIYALNEFTDEAGYFHEGWIRLRPSLRVVRAFLGY